MTAGLDNTTPEKSVTLGDLHGCEGEVPIGMGSHKDACPSLETRGKIPCIVRV